MIGLTIELAVLFALGVAMIIRRQTISEMLWHLKARSPVWCWALIVGVTIAYVLSWVHFFFGLWAPGWAH